MSLSAYHTERLEKEAAMRQRIQIYTSCEFKIYASEKYTVIGDEIGWFYDFSFETGCEYTRCNIVAERNYPNGNGVGDTYTYHYQIEINGSTGGLSTEQAKQYMMALMSAIAVCDMLNFNVTLLSK